MKILITGGAGFIGKSLSNYLLKNDFEVSILDNLSPQVHGNNATFDNSDVNFIKGDICDFELIKNLIGKRDFDVIYHLASETGTAQSMYEIERYVRVNELGTANLLQSVAESKNNKKTRLILSSSRSIYGEGSYVDEDGIKVTPPARSIKNLRKNLWYPISNNSNISLKPLPTDEDASIVPASLYAVTKYCQEQQFECICQAHGIPYGIVRFQNVYGEGQSLRNPYTGIISIFYNRLRQGLGVDLFEDGKPVRDFVHINDAVQGLTKLAEAIPNLTDQRIFNIGSGTPTTVKEVAQEILKHCDIENEITISGNFRLGDIRYNVACLKRAKKFLDFRPEVTLSEGISRFCSWASEEPIFQDSSTDALKKLKKLGLS